MVTGTNWGVKIAVDLKAGDLLIKISSMRTAVFLLPKPLNAA